VDINSLGLQQEHFHSALGHLIMTFTTVKM